MALRTFNTEVGKVAIITDTHFGARSDSLVFHDYFMRFYDQILFPWLVENNVKYLLHLGDFTDRRKYINFFTLNRVRKHFMAKLKELGITLIITIGNHDTFFKNTNEVNSMEELFSDTDNVIVLTEPEEVMFDDTLVLLMPWINEANYEKAISLNNNTEARVLMGHLELKGITMNRFNQRSEVGLDQDVFAKFDCVCSGHIHHKSDEGHIHHLGAPYEMTHADGNDPRGFHVWSPSQPAVIEFIQNPHKMFHRLYYDDKDKELGALLKKITPKYESTYVKVIVNNRTNPYYFEKYMDKLFSVNPADVKVEEDLKLTEGEEDATVDMAEDTLTILSKYVDSLEIDADKDKVKDELRSLYIEASNMER